MTLAMVVTVFVMWHLINAVLCDASDVTDMLLMTLQQCAIVFEFDLGWPASLSYLEPVFEAALFDVDLVQPNCVVAGWTYYDGFYLQLVLPLKKPLQGLIVHPFARIEVEHCELNFQLKNGPLADVDAWILNNGWCRKGSPDLEYCLKHDWHRNCFACSKLIG